MIRNVAAPTIIPLKFMSRKILEDKCTKIILIHADILWYILHRFQPLTLDIIAAVARAGMLRAAEPAQICLRSLFLDKIQ